MALREARTPNRGIASAEQRLSFERHGFLVIPDALDAHEVASVTAAVDQVWLRRRARPPIRGAEPLHLLAFLGEDERFLQLLDHPAVLPLVVEMLGWNVFVYHCHLDVHPPSGDASITAKWMWHQDGGIQNHDLETDPRPRMSVKVAYFLTDVSEAGRGNLVVLPGSHRRNAIERPADDDNDLADALPILADPGTAVLFDRRLWHMRSENTSELTRKALFYAYTFRWVRPRDDMIIAPEMREHLTPIREQLLGTQTAAIGHWMPGAEDAPLKAWRPAP